MCHFKTAYKGTFPTSKTAFPVIWTIARLKQIGLAQYFSNGKYQKFVQLLFHQRVIE
jgi:hypothetical protein